MKDLDQLLENSMRALDARNEFVFESTRQHVHSVIKGGSHAWPWITTLSAVAVISVAWYALQQMRETSVNVIVPVGRQLSGSRLPDRQVEEAVPMEIPPITLKEETIKQSPQTVNVRVNEDSRALMELFEAQSSLAESASKKGDHLLAATTYRDLARMCQLNNNSELARKAIDRAIEDARYVKSASFLRELEILAKSITN